MSKEDKILVEKLKNNDQVAFEKLFKIYSERIYYFSIRYLKNKEEAEEITQEVFVRLWKRRFELKTELSFSSYLFMIAKNAVIDLLRKRQKEADLNEDITPDISTIPEHAGDSLEYKELEQLVKESINQLPEKRRQIYLMSRNDGMTYKEIAEKLDISIKTVESHMRLALQQLKKSIGSSYELCLLGIFLLLFIH